MDVGFGRGSSVYSANRWFVGIIVLAIGGVGALLLHPSLHVALRAVNFRSSSAFLNVVPPDLRAVGLQMCGAVLIAVALAFCRYFIFPRLVRIDDSGIEVRGFLSPYRGRWSDFSGMKVVSRLGLKTVQLRFKKAQGFKSTVTLPAKLLGVDIKAVIADVAGRLSAPKTAIVLGSLDKYDPKKIAAAAPPEIAEGDDEADVQPASAPLLLLPSTRRRTFGKRSGTHG